MVPQPQDPSSPLDVGDRPAAELELRPLRPGEEGAASDMVARVFSQLIAPGYSQEGVDEFLRYSSAEAIAERRQSDHAQYLATHGERVVGVCELRGGDHLSLLFVDSEHHRRGIARLLFEMALTEARARRPRLERVTVNSSPYAVGVYRRLGFRETDSEQCVDGIVFVPMALDLSE